MPRGSSSSTASHTERDVLLARGKRLHDWPGNRYFRTLVNDYREAYAKAPRAAKNDVALEVVEKVHQHGGRFLRDHRGGWVELEEQRAVEKACAALREKGPISQRHASEERVTPSRSKRVTRSTPVRRAKSRRTYESEEEDEEEVEEENENASTVSDASMASPRKEKSIAALFKLNKEEEEEDEATEEEKSVAMEEEEKPIVAATPVDVRPSPVSVAENDMLYKLSKFQRQYGHAAVPPLYSADPALAEWCTAQRQLYRMTRSYRDASPTEEERLNNLRLDFDFCWDYEEWHWQRHFRALTERVPELPVDHLQKWWQSQVEAHKQGRVCEERVQMLRKVGYYL
jgi:hypothetical protein